LFDDEVDRFSGVVFFAAEEGFEDELWEADHDGERLGDHHGAEGADDAIMKAGEVDESCGITALVDVFRRRYRRWRG